MEWKGPLICVDTYIYSPPLYKIHASTEIGRHEACEIAANYNQKLSETKKIHVLQSLDGFLQLYT